MQDEQVREERGRPGSFRLTARLPEADVRRAVLDAVAPETTWAREEVAVEVTASGDDGWGEAERALARAAAAEQLTRYRFRVATTPDAPLLCSIQGSTSAAAARPGLKVLGLHVVARVVRRETSAVLAEVIEVRTDPTVRRPRPGVVQARAAGPAEEEAAREAMARDAGRAAVMALVERLEAAARTGGR